MDIGADLRGVLEILIAVLGLKGATVLVESPCDWVILRLLQSAGVRVIELPLASNGSLDPQLLARLLATEKVQMVLLSSGVSMPSGSVMPEDNRQRIARMLRQHGCWVLENDVYGELSHEPSEWRLRDLLDPERLLVFSTFEKLMGPEAPYGYLLSRHLSEQLQRHFLLRAFRLSPIRQKAIARLYGNGRIDQHLQVLRRLLRERKVQMTQLLQERLGDALQVIEPQGGASLWLEATRPVDMRRVFERLLAQRIVIAPGEIFSQRGLWQGHLRLCYTLDWDKDIGQALQRLVKAIQDEAQAP